MNNATASLTSIENDVSEFVAAMKDIRRGLLEANFSTTSQTESNPTSADSAAGPSNETTASEASTKPAVDTAPQAINLDLSARLQAELAAAERRTTYEVLQRDWLEWGEGVMRDIEKWLDRWDIGIADRVNLMGWADRLAWWGVKGSHKG